MLKNKSNFKIENCQIIFNTCSTCIDLKCFCCYLLHSLCFVNFNHLFFSHLISFGVSCIHCNFWQLFFCLFLPNLSALVKLSNLFCCLKAPLKEHKEVKTQKIRFLSSHFSPLIHALPTLTQTPTSRTQP